MLASIREDVTRTLAHAEFRFQPPPELPELPDFITQHFDPFSGDDDTRDLDGGALGTVTTTLPPLSYVRPEEPDLGTDPEEWEGKVSRNAPCPCGSGLKYKHCHGQVA